VFSEELTVCHLDAQVRITELPLGMWTDDFKETLEAFVETTTGVKGYANESTDSTVDFSITFASKDVADEWMAISEGSVTRLETALKMVGSSKLLSVTNMHAFDARGVIHKYDSPLEVVREFFVARLDGYVRRKAALLASMRADEAILAQKVAFLDHVIAGRLELHKRTSGGDLDADMETLGLVRNEEGSFRYLTGMALSSLTTDKKDALEKELAGVRAAIEDITATSAQTMWLNELDALDKALPEATYPRARS
jgi:DNA topoisomerase-2